MSPAYCNAAHTVGRLYLQVSNDGTFALGLRAGGSTRDCFTNEQLYSCQFPNDSRTKYCFGAALWIGAVLGDDTLVSTGADGWGSASEFHPDEEGFGNMIFRSTIDPARPEFEGAISEQDFLAVYYDTCTGGTCQGVNSTDFLDQRSHLPLHLKVTQNTYAWSYSYAQDFVLFDYGVTNIGDNRLHDVYMGIYVDADIHDEANDQNGYQDDFSGFRERQLALYLPESCLNGTTRDSDKVDIAWTSDNDGDLNQSIFQTVPHVTGTRIVRTPSDSLQVSFNWWVSNTTASLDYGPQALSSFRDFMTGGQGTPEGDRNKFHILSNKEFDYDQPRIGTITGLDDTWTPPPPSLVPIWAKGLDTRYVLSFGPFDIEPGQTLPITLAYVGGWRFHRTAANLDNLPDNPESWYQGMNWDSLGSSATWASWVYDNPGVDTDSDGYAGEFTICRVSGDSTSTVDTIWTDGEGSDILAIDTLWNYDVSDTVWRVGDGIPDFRGASPPPSPSTYTVICDGDTTRGLRVEPSPGQVTLRWNGVRSENTPDVFSRIIDFEGYRVWMGRDEREESFSLVQSYDIEDYNRWEWNADREDYELKEFPFRLPILRQMYGTGPNDQNWHPDTYSSRANPLQIPGGNEDGSDFIAYFVPQDQNQSILGHLEGANTAIRKTYPNAPRPDIIDIDTLLMRWADYPDSIDLYLTDDCFIQYYEYEFVFTGLLPTVSYWFNVTAFDFGSPKSGLEALETSKSLQPLEVYPLPSSAEATAGKLDAFVYPNPYRQDARYLERGLEGRGAGDRSVDRLHEIHFANLPAQCMIRIYSLDGDLIREIEHDFDADDPLANTDVWDMITRNSQLVVSGLYYWTVEEDSGRQQIGKLAIIM